MAKLLLFDVDGTLCLTGGAGMRGMERAFRLLFGVADAFQGVHMPGRTDPAILADALDRAGRAGTYNDVARFKDLYFRMLVLEIRQAPPDGGDDPSNVRRFKGVLPGVRETLDELALRKDLFLALLTGNYTRSAELKLAYFDLWAYFRCGAFGEDARERWELVDVALGRARRLGCPDVEPFDIWVIGDTPLDVEAARQAGVRSLGVATGGFSVEQLTEAGADVVLEQLSPDAVPF